MKVFWVIIYNILLYPLFFIFMTVLAIFNKKIRVGFIGQIKSYYILINYFNKININSNIYWFHCSSYGEYYQADLLMKGVKNKDEKNINILSFFSPSGYNNVSTSGVVDLITYIPFDFFWRFIKIFKTVNIKSIIISSYDVWPNFIWVAKRYNIPINVISASYGKTLIKSNFIVNSFMSSFYSNLSSIHTVDKIHFNTFEKLISNETDVKINISGNTRYDSVVDYSKSMKKRYPKHILERQNILILASLHKSDEIVILDSIFKFLSIYTDWSVIWSSHEPSKEDSLRVINLFNKQNLSTQIINESHLCNIKEQTLIVNKVGLLKELYWQSKLAYIGGGYSSGIHNLMEPAIAGVPTIFGPNHLKFNEAKQLLNQKGAVSINTDDSFFEALTSIVDSNRNLEKMSNNAIDVINKNSGAVNKILDKIYIK